MHLIRSFVPIAAVFLASALFTIYTISNDKSRRFLQVDLSNIMVNLPATSVITPRAFPAWDRNALPFPCILSETDPDSETDSSTGLLYIKIPKAASSLFAKITDRFSHREASRTINSESQTNNNMHCKMNKVMVHQTATQLDMKHRDKSKSFAFALLRDPKSRLLSHYYMDATMYKRSMDEGMSEEEAFKFTGGLTEISNESFFKKIKEYPPNFHLHYLGLDKLSTSPSDEEIIKTIDGILTSYNFLGIYERFFESMIVFSMISGANIEDVLYTNTDKPCQGEFKYQTIDPQFEQTWQAHFDSDEWKEREKGDFLLYDAVNKSLDLTIDLLGRENVQRELEKYNNLMTVGNFINIPGCGVPEMREFPFHDLADMAWFKNRITEQQQNLIKSWTH